MDERRSDPSNVASRRSDGVAVLTPDADLAAATYGLSRSFGTVNAVIDVDPRSQVGGIVKEPS